MSNLGFEIKDDSSKMKAFVYEDWGKIVVKDVLKPTPGEKEVLLKVTACGICGSELETFKSKSERRIPPLVLGHEFIGIVEECGSGCGHLKKGQAALVNSVISCGSCEYCKTGQTNLCKNREVFGMHRPGAAAEYVIAPVEFVYPVSSDFPIVGGALVEPLANAVHVVELLPNEKEPFIIIYGSGPIGLMILQACKVLLNAEVLMIDLNDNRLSVAEKVGADHVLNSKRESVDDYLSKLGIKNGVDISIDAVGTEHTKKESTAVLKAGGITCWIGLYDNELVCDSYNIVLEEKRIVGSYSATKADFLKAADLIYSGKVDGESWVSTFEIDRAEEAFKRMLKPEGKDLKAVILP